MADNKYYGIYQGIVTNITDPDKRGRLKAKCPDVLGGETESAWCDPMIPVAYDKGGDFCIPQVQEAVWMMFIGGDANKPVWLGGWWKKEQTPLGASYTGIDKLRIISYGNTTITMTNGVININVGAGECDLKIEDGKVTVKGNLRVEGSVTCSVLNAGDVFASQGEKGGGHIKADVDVKAPNLPF